MTPQAPSTLIGIGLMLLAPTVAQAMLSIGPAAEFTILVSDAYQGDGLGTEMLRRLVDIGRQEGITRIFGNILGDNANMLRVTERLGFTLVGSTDGVMRVELGL